MMAIITKSLDKTSPSSINCVVLPPFFLSRMLRFWTIRSVTKADRAVSMR